MLKISYAGCLGLSPAILVQVTLEMRVAAQNHEKFTKTPILEVQGHSTSSMLTFLKSSSPVLVMISSMSVPICNHFHIREANSAFLRECPFCPSFMGTPFTQQHEIMSRNTRNSMLSCGENLKSLSRLVLKR